MTSKSLLFKISMVLLCALSGCATIDIRGHEVDSEQLKQIRVGETKKATVVQLLGTPSAVSPFGNTTWFYMADKTSTRAFLSPSVLASNITRIEFDEKGVVKCLESLTEVDKQVIAHIHRSTPTAGHEFGVIEQIFGNVGRFNGKDPDMGRRGH
jgi:outer membrane protein assembly factor BamE (lipoprotein component of BamABCDE complex)